LLNGDLISLIYTAGEILHEAKNPSQLKFLDFPSGRNVEARQLLEKSHDWKSADITILGSLYEALIEVNDEKESKQTLRRRTGSFYTPPYITDFLVRSAYENSGREIVDPVILDPACGSGAFLISAFKFLREKIPGKSPDEILTTCIRGVDIDKDAIRVAKISLWIESGAEKSTWRKLGKCFTVGDSLKLGVEGEIDFAPIVVSNPPYRNVKRGIDKKTAQFCHKNFVTATRQWDISSVFIENTLTNLLTDRGTMGFIIPQPLMTSENYEPLRKFILDYNLISFGSAGTPFHEPGVEASLIVINKSKPSRGNIDINRVDGEKILTDKRLDRKFLNFFPYTIFSHTAKQNFISRILKRTDRFTALGDHVMVTRGIEIGKNSPLLTSGNAGEPVLRGEDVSEFTSQNKMRIKFTSRDSREKLVKDDILWAGENQLILRRVASQLVAAVVDPPSLALNTLYIVHSGKINPHSACALFNSIHYREIFRQFYGFDDSLFPYIRISQLKRMPVVPGLLNDNKLAAHSVKIHELNKKNSGSNAGEIEILRSGIDEIVEAYFSE
jgi:hypothetical protein